MSNTYKTYFPSCPRCGRAGTPIGVDDAFPRAEVAKWLKELCHDCKSVEGSISAVIDSRLDEIVKRVVAAILATPINENASVNGTHPQSGDTP